MPQMLRSHDLQNINQEDTIQPYAPHPKLQMLKISKSTYSFCIYLVSFGFHAVFKLVPTRLHSNKN